MADWDGDGGVTQAEIDQINTVAGGANHAIGEDNYNPDMDIDRNGDVQTADYTIANNEGTHSALAKGLLTQSSVDNQIGWDGYVFKAETRQYCVRNHTYDPIQGRWLERDLAGYADGMNLYDVARSNPATLTDPKGTSASSPNQGSASGFWKDKDACGFSLWDGCQRDPFVKRALAYAEKACKGKKCSQWTLQCQKLGETNCPKGTKARTCCKDCTITICKDSKGKLLGGCALLAHELIHAGDLCRAGCASSSNAPNCDTFPSCRALVCSEMRGIYNECCSAADRDKCYSEQVKEKKKLAWCTAEWNDPQLEQKCKPNCNCDPMIPDPFPDWPGII